MSDGTILNPGTGGDTIATEQPGGVGAKIPVTKIRVGALDVDGGDVTATNPFDVRIGDATNTASVKAASTAAVATDKALVVAVSPNNVVPVSGAFFQATQPVSVAGTVPVSLAAAVDVSDRVARLVGHVTVDNASLPVTGTFFQGTQPVSAAALPLPAGASTEATLASASAKLPATLGQKVMAGSLAVTLASDQGGIPVTGTFFQAMQPVSIAAAVDTSDRVARLLGHVTIDNASLPVTGAFFQGTQPVSIAATVTADVSDRTARLLGHVIVDSVPTTAVTGTFFQTTQPVSATALPLPTGASTEATLALIKAKTDNLDVALSTRAVTGLTDAQLRATAVAVSLVASANSIGAVTAAKDEFGAAQPLAVSLRNGALELIVADRAQRDGLDAANLTLADIRDAVQGLPTATAAAVAPPAVQAVSGTVNVTGLVSALIQGSNEQGLAQALSLSNRSNLSSQAAFDGESARQLDDIILLLTDIRDALWRGFGQ